MPKNFAQYKRIIDQWLAAYLQEKENSLKTVNSWGPDGIDKLLHFISNGKTIRGGLVLFACEAYGKPIDENAKKVAAAVELLQSALLIHDDIIDQDRTRRGDKTLYVQYEDMAPSLSIQRNVEFGSSMALCLGDMTFFLALEMITSLSDARMANTLGSMITREYTNICLAQMQDVHFGFSKNLPTEEEVLSVYRYKTARYTFSLPLMLGAMLAEASPKEVEVLEKLGEQVGLAFQLNDDLLNLFGTEAAIGKSVGSDIREDKKTIISVYLQHHMSPEEKNHLNELSRKNDTVGREQYIHQTLLKYHIEDIAKKKSIEYSELAIDAISSLSMPDSHAQELRAIIEYCSTRTK